MKDFQVRSKLRGSQVLKRLQGLHGKDPQFRTSTFRRNNTDKLNVSYWKSSSRNQGHTLKSQKEKHLTQDQKI